MRKPPPLGWSDPETGLLTALGPVTPSRTQSLAYQRSWAGPAVPFSAGQPCQPALAQVRRAFGAQPTTVRVRGTIQRAGLGTPARRHPAGNRGRQWLLGYAGPRAYPQGTASAQGQPRAWLRAALSPTLHDPLCVTGLRPPAPCWLRVRSLGPANQQGCPAWDSWRSWAAPSLKGWRRFSEPRGCHALPRNTQACLAALRSGS